MSKAIKNNNNTVVKEVATMPTFSEKIALCNAYLEGLRIDVEVAKLDIRLDKLIKKDELTKEELELVDTLSTRKAELITIKKEYIEKIGTIPTFEDAISDKFAFMCAWAINPQKGNSYKDGQSVNYDISFNGMYKVVTELKTYYRKHLDKSDSTDKATARKDLLTHLSEFVNQYLPHDKVDNILTPCNSSTFTLTFAKYNKDTTILSSRDFGYPKNCMTDGYKPMHVKFVDTDEKPMLKSLLSILSSRYKWTKSGIDTNKVDDYAIVQQIFLCALKYTLDFNVESATRSTPKNAI